MNKIRNKLSTIEYGNRELRGTKRTLGLRLLFYICALFGVDSERLINVDRLLDKKPIYFLGNNKRDWRLVRRNKNGDLVYKHKRYGKLMKTVNSDGEIIREAYRFDLVGGLNDKERLYQSTVVDILHRMYPINFPYYPEDTPYVVFCTDFNVDHTDDSEFMLRYVKPTKYVEIKEVFTPEGVLNRVYRYFRIYAKNVYEEISSDEYFDIYFNRMMGRNDG